MIARVWKGWASQASADAYAERFRTTVREELRGIEGFVEAKLLRRAVGDEVEFVVVTSWRSLDAIRRFAGADFETAVVSPRAQALLTRYEDRVAHFEEVFTAAGVDAAPRA